MNQGWSGKRKRTKRGNLQWTKAGLLRSKLAISRPQVSKSRKNEMASYRAFDIMTI